MKVYFKERQKSHLVKHYHQQELKRLDKKLTEIKHRKKGIFPYEKENSLPILTPRYHLTIGRQQEIKEENDRLSSRIAETKIKESTYFRKILKEKERINNMQLKEKHELESQQVKLIYSSSVANILQGGLDGSFLREEKWQGKSGIRAFTQRVHRMQKKVSEVV